MLNTKSFLEEKTSQEMPEKFENFKKQFGELKQEKDSEQKTKKQEEFLKNMTEYFKDLLNSQIKEKILLSNTQNSITSISNLNLLLDPLKEIFNKVVLSGFCELRVGFLTAVLVLIRENEQAKGKDKLFSDFLSYTIRQDQFWQKYIGQFYRSEVSNIVSNQQSQEPQLKKINKPSVFLLKNLFEQTLESLNTQKFLSENYLLSLEESTPKSTYQITEFKKITLFAQLFELSASSMDRMSGFFCAVFEFIKPALTENLYKEVKETPIQGELALTQKIEKIGDERKTIKDLLSQDKIWEAYFELYKKNQKRANWQDFLKEILPVFAEQDVLKSALYCLLPVMFSKESVNVFFTAMSDFFAKKSLNDVAFKDCKDFLVNYESNFNPIFMRMVSSKETKETTIKDFISIYIKLLLKLDRSTVALVCEKIFSVLNDYKMYIISMWLCVEILKIIPVVPWKKESGILEKALEKNIEEQAREEVENETSINVKENFINYAKALFGESKVHQKLQKLLNQINSEITISMSPKDFAYKGIKHIESTVTEEVEDNKKKYAKKFEEILEKYISKENLAQCYLTVAIDLQSPAHLKKYCLEKFDIEQNLKALEELLFKPSLFITHGGFDCIPNNYKSPLKIMLLIQAIAEARPEKKLEYDYNLRTVLKSNSELQRQFKLELMKWLDFYSKPERKNDKLEGMFYSFIDYLKHPNEVKRSHDQKNLEMIDVNEQKVFSEARNFLRKCYNAFVENEISLNKTSSKITVEDINSNKLEDVLEYWNYGIVSRSDKESEQNTIISFLNQTEINIRESIKIGSSNCVKDNDPSFKIKDNKVMAVSHINLSHMNLLQGQAEKFVNEVNSKDEINGVIKFIAEKIKSNHYREDKILAKTDLEISQLITIRNVEMQLFLIYCQLENSGKKDIKKDAYLKKMLETYMTFASSFIFKGKNDHACYFLKTKLNIEKNFTDLTENELKNVTELLYSDDIGYRPSTTRWKDSINKKLCIAASPLAWSIFNGLTEYWKANKKDPCFGALSGFLRTNWKLLGDPMVFIAQFIIEMTANEFNLTENFKNILKDIDAFLTIVEPAEYLDLKNKLINVIKINQDSVSLSLSELIAVPTNKAPDIKNCCETFIKELTEEKNLKNRAPFYQCVAAQAIVKDEEQVNLNNLISQNLQPTFFGNLGNNVNNPHNNNNNVIHDTNPNNSLGN